MKQLISVALSLLCLAISIPSIKAEENGRFPKNLFVEFGVGFLSYGDKILPSKAKNTMLTPIIGYKFHPRWAAGFGVTFPTGKERLYKPMPSLFLSYDFLQINKFSTFAQLQGTYGKNPTIRWLDSMEGGTPPGYYNNEVQRDLWECGFRLGASYSFNDHISANIRYLFVGYSNRSYPDNYRGGVLGDHDFIIDAGLRSLQISVRYTF